MKLINHVQVYSMDLTENYLRLGSGWILYMSLSVKNDYKNMIWLSNGYKYENEVGQCSVV